MNKTFFLTAFTAVMVLSTAFIFLPVPKGHDVQAHIGPRQPVKVISNIDSISNNNTNITGTFLRYENNTYGISIDYPLGWLVKPLTSLLLQTGVASPQTHTIAFVSPINSSSVNVVIEPYLNPKMTLHDYASASLDNVRQVFPNFHIVQDLTPTTLAGHPAYKAAYTVTAGTGNDREFMEITTKTIDKGYSITFSSPPDLYNVLLPIEQKMIDSFKIMSNFLRYENKTNAISIDYPSDWIVNPPPSSLGVGEQMFRFVSPDGQIVIGRVVQPLITNTSKEYIDEQVNYGKQFIPGFKIENLTPTTLAGHPAYHIVYTASMGKMKYESMHIAAIIGEKMYDIAYVSQPDLYNASLPVVQKMIDSFSHVTAAAPQRPITFRVR